MALDPAASIAGHVDDPQTVLYRDKIAVTLDADNTLRLQVEDDDDFVDVFLTKAQAIEHATRVLMLARQLPDEVKR